MENETEMWLKLLKPYFDMMEIKDVKIIQELHHHDGGKVHISISGDIVIGSTCGSSGS